MSWVLHAAIVARRTGAADRHRRVTRSFHNRRTRNVPFVILTTASSSFPAAARLWAGPRGFYGAALGRVGGAISGWPLLRWAPPVLVLTALALSWWFTSQRLQSQEDQLWEAALSQQAAVASSLQESLVQAVDKGHLMALIAAEALDGAPQEVAQTRRRLLAMQAADPTLLRFAVLDAQGERLLSSTPVQDGVAQLALVAPALLRSAARQQSPAARQVQVLPVLPGGKEFVPDTPNVRPVSLLLGMPPAWAAQGDALSQVPSPGGFLLQAIDLVHFLGPYRGADMHTGTHIQVLAPDGSVLAALQDHALLASPPGQRQAVLAQQPGVQGHGRLRLDDQQLHLVSWRRNAGTPFTVVVSQDLPRLLAEHRANSRRAWGLLALLTAITLLATLALARVLGRQHHLFQALSVADAKNQSLIEQLEQEKIRALELAGSDHLTGLHNRRMFNELVASHLALARRSPKHYALLYLDLDRFKQINDSLGHHVGDLLLQAVAQRLRSLVRGSDIIGRMGGDEFAVLVTAMEQLADMDQLASKLVAQLSQPYVDLDGHSLQLSPSIGIAFFPRDGHDVATLCQHADMAMYASKRAGRGRATYYDTQLNPADDRGWQLERELAQAIAGEQLVLHFQPKVRLEDCRIEGFEALVRWQHPAFGLIYPGEFIALAEKNGLIAELGDWVIRACCQQAAAWRQQGLDTVPIAVNVSALQLRDTAFPTRMATYLQQYGVRASDLELEITESCLVEPVDLAVRVLNQLEGMGMRIGLDDFGTGFSSLSQIRHLPIDTIKLDRSFVDDIRSSPEAGVLVTSIITLAHNLKMRVVAEGVELRDQLVYLKTAGCDAAQGYILSRPVPAQETQRLLRQGILEPA
jgi:diguanylate cyclase (GGDEF)-like protein